MSMIPFFPSLKPNVYFDNPIVNEEAEILKYEREHHAWLESMKNSCSDLHPLGKVLTMIGVETDDEEANDDSEDTDSHDDEDDDTNDRALAVLPDRAALGLYSPADDVNLNDDISATTPRP